MKTKYHKELIHLALFTKALIKQVMTTKSSNQMEGFGFESIHKNKNTVKT